MPSEHRPLNKRVKISKTGRPYVDTKDLVESALKRSTRLCELCKHEEDPQAEGVCISDKCVCQCIFPDKDAMNP